MTVAVQHSFHSIPSSGNRLQVNGGFAPSLDSRSSSQHATAPSGSFLGLPPSLRRKSSRQSFQSNSSNSTTSSISSFPRHLATQSAMDPPKKQSAFGKFFNKLGSSSSSSSSTARGGGSFYADAGPADNQAPPAYDTISSSAASNQYSGDGKSSNTYLPEKAPINPFNSQPESQYTSAGADEIDDPYAFLREYDTMFLIDDSGSMIGSRWKQAREAVKDITPICVARDADGIDILFLNNDVELTHVTEASTVQEAFTAVNPMGRTPTGRRLRYIFNNYLKKYEHAGHWDAVRPLNILVITDGAATDGMGNTVKEVIQWFARRLDETHAEPRQLGVQFFQIGNDASATDMLETLDDKMPGVRDIVDTYKYYPGSSLNPDEILKVVGGAISRRLDNSTPAQIQDNKAKYAREQKRVDSSLRKGFWKR